MRETIQQAISSRVRVRVRVRLECHHHQVEHVTDINLDLTPGWNKGMRSFCQCVYMTLEKLKLLPYSCELL